jgi:hypothetical protein
MPKEVMPTTTPTGRSACNSEEGALCGELGLLRFEIGDLFFGDRQISRVVHAV